MLDHVKLHVSDYERSKEFYSRALEPLGIGLIMEPVEGVAGFGSDGKPYFWIAAHPEAHSGVHVAFGTDSHDVVDAFHAAALEAGATDNGPPGPRPIYHPGYYGGFVRDPDANNIEACCHVSQG